jgi:hypothetical protein
VSRQRPKRAKLKKISYQSSDKRRCPKTGKTVYQSFAKAQKVANKLSGMARGYLCTLCGHWHITSLTRSEYDRHQLRWNVIQPQLQNQEEEDAMFNFNEPGSGEYVKPEQLQNHLVIMWVVGYRPHVQTKFTRPDKLSDGIVVDIVDLDQTDADGKPGKVYRAQTFLQSRLIQTLRPALGEDPLLGTIAKGTASPGMNAPWVFLSLTNNPEAVAKAQEWAERNTSFAPTPRSVAEAQQAKPAMAGHPQQQPHFGGQQQGWGGAQPQPQQQSWGQSQQGGWGGQQQPQQPASTPPLPPEQQSILDRLRTQQSQQFQGGDTGGQQQYGF